MDIDYRGFLITGLYEEAHMLRSFFKVLVVIPVAVSCPATTFGAQLADPWGYSAWIQLSGDMLLRSAPSDIVSAESLTVHGIALRVYKYPELPGTLKSPTSLTYAIPMSPSGTGSTPARIKLIENSDHLKKYPDFKNAFVVPKQSMIAVRSSRKTEFSGGLGLKTNGMELHSFQARDPDYLVLTTVDTWGAGFRDAWSLGEKGGIASTWFLAGAEHFIVGRVHLGELIIDSDPEYPLVFKFVKDRGYVYLSGHGSISDSSGTSVKIGGEQTVDSWIEVLGGKDQLGREGAAQALGWLSRTSDDINKAIPALIRALGDEAWEVRRNAAEALGRICDVRARDQLSSHTNETVEKNEWVREVCKEALNKCAKKP